MKKKKQAKHWSDVQDDVWYEVYAYLNFNKLIELYAFYNKKNSWHSKIIKRNLDIACELIYKSLPKICTGRKLKGEKQEDKNFLLNCGKCIHPRGATGHYEKVFIPIFNTKEIHLSNTHFLVYNERRFTYCKKKYKLCNKTKVIQYPSVVSRNIQKRGGITDSICFHKKRVRLNENPSFLNNCTIIKRSKDECIVDLVIKVADIIVDEYSKNYNEYIFYSNTRNITKYFFTWLVSIDKSGGIFDYVFKRIIDINKTCYRKGEDKKEYMKRFYKEYHQLFLECFSIRKIL